MAAMELKEALKAAQDEGRAILAANFYNLETLQGISQAAAAMKQPVILQLTRSSIEYMGLQTAVALARSVIYHFEIEAWLHLDHGDSIDLVKRCLDAGFDSVMIDASAESFADNVRITRQVVNLAKDYGACVEAELGYVAKLGQEQAKEGFTKPAEARLFVDETGVDMLAVAIGSAHGFYKQTPNLNLQRLREIRAAVDVPLVLHGGSGIPKEQLLAAIAYGICKVNVATETKNAFMNGLKTAMARNNEIDLRKVFPVGIEAVRDLIKEKIAVLNGVAG